MIRTTIICDVCKRPIPKNKPFLQIVKQAENDIKAMRHVCFGCIYEIAKNEINKKE